MNEQIPNIVDTVLGEERQILGRHLRLLLTRNVLQADYSDFVTNDNSTKIIVQKLAYFSDIWLLFNQINCHHESIKKKIVKVSHSIARSPSSTTVSLILVYAHVYEIVYSYISNLNLSDLLQVSSSLLNAPSNLLKAQCYVTSYIVASASIQKFVQESVRNADHVGQQINGAKELLAHPSFKELEYVIVHDAASPDNVDNPDTVIDFIFHCPFSQEAMARMYATYNLEIAIEALYIADPNYKTKIGQICSLYKLKAQDRDSFKFDTALAEAISSNTHYSFDPVYDEGVRNINNNVGNTFEKLCARFIQRVPGVRFGDVTITFRNIPLETHENNPDATRISEDITRSLWGVVATGRFWNISFTSPTYHHFGPDIYTTCLFRGEMAHLLIQCKWVENRASKKVLITWLNSIDPRCLSSVGARRRIVEMLSERVLPEGNVRPLLINKSEYTEEIAGEKSSPERGLRCVKMFLTRKGLQSEAFEYIQERNERLPDEPILHFSMQDMQEMDPLISLSLHRMVTNNSSVSELEL
eukprot:Nk52_evm1s54 gene=Nk52_evmTU1s54